MLCEYDELIHLVERKLLETIASGSPKETLRILSERLLKVLGTRDLYEKSTICAGDKGVFKKLKAAVADSQTVDDQLLLFR